MLSRWALVRTADNLVVNVIEWDGVTPYIPPEGTTTINCDEKVAGPGFTYDPATGDFIDPPTPPDPDAP